jgi:beta-glucanase (GH16 family)
MRKNNHKHTYEHNLTGKESEAESSNIINFDSGDYVLTFADEFNESTFSAWTGYGSNGRWATSIRPTEDDSRTISSNNELQYYVDPDMDEFENPFSLNDGALSINASRLDVNQSALADELAYSSGNISTQQSFKFEGGYVEIRAKVPGETGMWSALWLQTEVEGGTPKEIDILEVLGSDPTMAFQDSHGNDTDVSYTTDIDTSDDFHTYAVLWEEDTITWLIDGNVVRSEENFVHEEMFLTINLAIGGWAQDPNLSTDFNQGLEVDYVRIYQPVEDVTEDQHLQVGENYQSFDAFIGTTDSDVMLGSRWADDMTGSIGDDVISSRAGDDHLNADAGNDTVYGGAGNDIIEGGDGQDSLYGGTGNDTLQGNSENDFIYGEQGNDLLEGGTGVDHLYGGSGNDQLQGGSGNDKLFGNNGNDIIFGNDGVDVMAGGDGADLIDSGAGNDHMWGGNFNADGKIDVFSFSQNCGADTIYDFENTIDLINLTSFSSEYDQVQDSISSIDGGIFIDLNHLGGLDGDSITLYGLSLEQVNQDMFII